MTQYLHLILVLNFDTWRKQNLLTQSILGDYTLIAGRLLNTSSSSSSDRIVVDAYKMQHFKTSSKHELTWPFEVVHISQRVYHSNEHT